MRANRTRYVVKQRAVIVNGNGQANGQELGTIANTWAGIGKELFTTADSYMVTVSNHALARPKAGTPLLAAGWSIDLALEASSG